MPTQNIECQLAQGQLNRYLAGDAISEAALVQLEGHVGECETCRLMLVEKRKALENMITPQTAVVSAPDSAKASVVERETPHEAASPVPRFLIDAIRKGVPNRDKNESKLKISTHAVIDDQREALPTKSAFVKPMMYSLGLAAVLIVMSTVMRDPTRFLGDRVGPAKKSESANAKGVTKDSVAKAQPATTAPLIQSPLSQPDASTLTIDSERQGPVAEGSANPVSESIVTESSSDGSNEPIVESSRTGIESEPTSESSPNTTESTPTTTTNSRNESAPPASKIQPETPTRKASTSTSKRSTRTTTAKRRTATKPTKKRQAPAPVRQPNRVRVVGGPKTSSSPETDSGPKLRVYDEDGNVVQKP